MKKIIKTIGVLVAFAGLSCNLSSCFFPSQTEKELSYEEMVEKGKVKNFTITQKEGTNILVFKWEKPEYLWPSYDNEVEYIIKLDDMPDSGESIMEFRGNISCKESADSTVIQKEYMLTDFSRYPFKKSGNYYFYIYQKGYPVSPSTMVTASILYTRNILIPKLEILEISDEDSYWKFNFNQLGKDSGNFYFVLYIGEQNDIANASIVDYGHIFNPEELYIVKEANPKLIAGKSYYAWVKLADDLEYDEDHNIIDSSKYGEASNSVCFTLPAIEEE